MRIALSCLILSVSGLTACERRYDIREGLSYDPAIGYRGSFDLYEPLADSVRTARPAVVVIHGGAWRGGDKAWGAQFANKIKVTCK